MPSITTEILKGAKWTGMSSLVITIVQIAQFAVLGNILTKQEFGVVGMITTVVTFSQIILDMGFGAALIQKENISNKQLSTLYWLNIFAGIVLFFLLFFLSPVIAEFYNQDVLVNLIRVLAIMFLIAPIGQQFQYMMQKELKFNLLSKIEIVTNILSFGLLIVLLFLVQNILAYVISQVFLQSLKGLLYCVVYIKKWRPSLEFDLKSVKNLMSFGVFQLLSRLVNRIGANADYIFIGRFLGAEALGIYSLAYQVITVPVLRINPIVTRVAFPVFSKKQNDDSALSSGFINISSILSLISMPLLVGLIAVSDLFIITVFGERWLKAVEIMNILAIVGLLRVLMNPTGSVLLAKGKANISFYWDLGVMVLYGLTFYFASKYNIYVVAWTYVITSIINFLFGRWLLKKLIDLKMKVYTKAIFKPLLLTCIMAIVVYFLKLLSSNFINNYKLNLIILVIVGGGIYLIELYIAYPNLFKKILLKKRAGQK